MNLNYVILTTINHNDLKNQNTKHITHYIRTTQQTNPNLLIEILIPNFQKKTTLIQQILDSKTDVLTHNIKTITQLTKKVRNPHTKYHQSLKILHYLKTNTPKHHTKSSLILKLKKTQNEIFQTIQNIQKIDMDFLTLKQYLQPTHKHLKIKHFLPPKKFKKLQQTNETLNFDYVTTKPLIHSSYKTTKFYIEHKIRKQT